MFDKVFDKTAWERRMVLYMFEGSRVEGFEGHREPRKEGGERYRLERGLFAKS